MVAPQGGEQGAITKRGHNRIGGGRSCHLQEKTVSIVGLAVFVHTVYLIQILSSINHVYGEFL